MATLPEPPRRPVSFRAGPVLLRSADRADAAGMHAAVRESAAELNGTMGWWRDGLTEADMDQWLAYCAAKWDEGGHFEFTVSDPDGGFVGSAGVGPVRWDTRSANLSYWIRTSRTGRGIGSAAARAVARWACQRLGLDRVEIVVAVGNVASQRLAARAGAVREGVARNRLYWSGRSYDAVVFSFVPDDFPPAGTEEPHHRG